MENVLTAIERAQRVSDQEDSACLARLSSSFAKDSSLELQKRVDWDMWITDHYCS